MIPKSANGSELDFFMACYPAKRRGAEPLLHLLDQSVEDTELFALTSRVKRVGDAPYLSRVSFRVTVPSVVTSL